METKHTPGPWVADQLYSDNGDVVIWGGGDEEPEWIAEAGTVSNARLIAAAPDLLAQLKVCLLRIERPDLSPDASWVAEKARAAIAKATGAQP